MPAVQEQERDIDYGAERALLRLMYYNWESCSGIVNILNPEDFETVGLSKIYSALRQIIVNGTKPNYTLLKTELNKNGGFLEAGGNEGLLSIFKRKGKDDKLSAQTAESYADQYTKIIKEQARKRKIRIIGTRFLNEVSNPSVQSGALINGLKKQLTDVSKSIDDNDGISDMGEVMADVFDEIGDRRKSDSDLVGLSTGFRDLNTLTLGLKPSDLIILAARPSMGKTAFALNIASNVAMEQNQPVLFFSMEMSSIQLGIRILSAYSGTDSRKLNTGDIDDVEWVDLMKVGEKLMHAPMHIVDKGGLQLADVERIAREQKAKYGIKLIVIDYIQLMFGGKSARDGRTQEVSEISRGLKALAKELNVPVIALSQLSRAVESRVNKRPQLSDLRESGSIEQDADIVIFLYREVYYAKDKEGMTPDDMDNIRDDALVLVSKNRNGATGNIKMRFISSLTKFADMPQPSIID